jgi:hypothetical protein
MQVGYSAPTQAQIMSDIGLSYSQVGCLVDTWILSLSCLQIRLTCVSSSGWKQGNIV